MPEIFAQTSAFADCANTGRDLHQILTKLLTFVREYSELAYILIADRVESTATWIEKERIVCEVVPEIDIMLKDQFATYNQNSPDAITAELKKVEDSIRKALKSHESPIDTEFTLVSPVRQYIEANRAFAEIIAGFSFMQIFAMALLSMVVIYSLMVNDVDE